MLVLDLVGTPQIPRLKRIEQRVMIDDRPSAKLGVQTLSLGDKDTTCSFQSSQHRAQALGSGRPMEDDVETAVELNPTAQILFSRQLIGEARAPPPTPPP